MSKYEDKNKREYCLKCLERYVPKEQRQRFLCEMECLEKVIEEEAFMEGYQYAIQILQDSIKKKFA